MFFFVFVIIQSYTRFLWLLALICICYRIVLSIKKPIVLALILILFSSFSIYLFNNISDKESPVNIIATRFNDTHSLDIKMIQSQKLLTEFYKTPILGKGSGSYVPGYVRDERQKYQYENQIISSLMQFGIIGLTFLLILPFGIFFRLLSTNLLSSYVLSGVFLLFILSGFSNPNLTIISSCFIYSLFYSYKHYLNGPT
ncbi:O-antigen ligase family protein [Vibrio parahaemolyticus]